MIRFWAEERLQLVFCQANCDDFLCFLIKTVANPHLKLQIALTWTIDAITLLKNTIWLDTSALLDLDSTMMSDLFLSPKLQIPHRF